MSKGFITEAYLRRKGKDDGDQTNLQIEDRQIADLAEGEFLIDMFIDELGDTLSFALSDAKQIAEAFTEIINRYETKGSAK